jgi:hypothetical protein
LYANSYHKRVDRKDAYLPHALKDLENIWARLPARRGLIKNLPVFDLPNWAVEELVNNQCRDWPNDFVDRELMWRPETRYDATIEPKIWRVDLWRIIHDSEQLLDELAAWLGCPVNDLARATWANYLKRQQELVPWLDDQ